jgi:IS1 family transposase
MLKRYAETCLWLAKLLKSKKVSNWRMYAIDGQKSILKELEEKTNVIEFKKSNLKLVA